MSIDGQAHATQFDDAGQQHLAGVFGMWVFLATELMLFGPLFLGFLYGRAHDPAAFAAASRHADVLLGGVNTVVLLTSSLAIAMAVAAGNAGAWRLAARLLWAVTVLGVVFLAIKGMEYRNDWSEHLVPAAGWDFRFPDPALANGARMFYGLYFVMTGLHAVHMAVGIAVVAMNAVACSRASPSGGLSRRIEISALYWHFIDIVWLFLFPLLYLTGRAGP